MKPSRPLDDEEAEDKGRHGAKRCVAVFSDVGFDSQSIGQEQYLSYHAVTKHAHAKPPVDRFPLEIDRRTDTRTDGRVTHGVTYL